MSERWVHLGNLAVSPHHSVSLSCHHCEVVWQGCAAESWCPRCGSPKGYNFGDIDECYCEICRPRDERESRDGE